MGEQQRFVNQYADISETSDFVKELQQVFIEQQIIPKDLKPLID